METTLLIGRILLGGYFVLGGINHFSQKASLTGYAQSKNIPLPGLSVMVTGLLMIAGGLGILLWQFVPVAILLLVLFLLPTTILMHAFWKQTDDAAKQSDMREFLKNMGLLGALLILYSVSNLF